MLSNKGVDLESWGSAGYLPAVFVVFQKKVGGKKSDDGKRGLRGNAESCVGLI